MKTLWKIFSRFVASILSTIMLVLMLLLPLVSFITDYTSAENVVDFIFSSGLLDQLSTMSNRPHNVMLSNGTVDTGNHSHELNKLVDMLKEMVGSEEMTFLEFANALKAKLDSGEIDSKTLSAALQELIDNEDIDIEQMAHEFGIPEGLYKILFAPDGTVDVSAAVNTFQALMDSGLLDMETLLEEIGIPADANVDTEKILTKLSQSSAAKELISIYAEDLLNAATGENKDSGLTADKLIDIVNSNMDELIDIVEDAMPENVTINRDKLASAIDKAASATLPTIMEILPPAEDLVGSIVDLENPTISLLLDILKFVRRGYLRLAFIGAILVLAILIFLLMLPSFSGLSWFGKNAIFGALLIGVLCFVMGLPQLRSAIASIAPEAAGLLTTLISSLSSTFIVFVVIYAVTGVISIIGSRLLNERFAPIED